MAERGDDTLRFGPMKPVGLDDPRTGRWPCAVVQLRREDLARHRLQPGRLPDAPQAAGAARGVRAGAGAGGRRASCATAPSTATPSSTRPPCSTTRTRCARAPALCFAGQITGVEGYVESIASGLLTALALAAALGGKPLDVPPGTTALGGLWRHARGTLRAEGNTEYAPSNVTWAMLPPVDEEPVAPGQKRRKLGKGEKRARLVARARRDLDAWWRAR